MAVTQAVSLSWGLYWCVLLLITFMQLLAVPVVSLHQPRGYGACFLSSPQPILPLFQRNRRHRSLGGSYPSSPADIHELLQAVLQRLPSLGGGELDRGRFDEDVLVFLRHNRNPVDVQALWDLPDVL